MAKKKEDILEQEGIIEDEKQKKTIVNEIEVKCKVAELFSIDTLGLKVDVENKGIGDVFISDSPVNLISGENLVKVGEAKSFEAGKIYIFSYSRPIVKLTLYK